MRCPAPLLVADVVHEDGSVVLALRGELDLATVPVLVHAVDEVLAPHLRAVTPVLTRRRPSGGACCKRLIFAQVRVGLRQGQLGHHGTRLVDSRPNP